MRGRLAGLSLTRRDRWHWRDLKEDQLGTDFCSCAAGGFSSGGVEVSLRAAIHWRWSISKGRGGRHDSTARMGIGVAEKELVAHHWTLLQKLLSLSCIFMRGVDRSDQ